MRDWSLVNQCFGEALLKSLSDRLEPDSRAATMLAVIDSAAIGHPQTFPGSILAG
jgi:hypothetical protein